MSDRIRHRDWILMCNYLPNIEGINTSHIHEAIKDIRKKQSAYIKELLIELVTNEITEISTREVVNVLGEPV